MCDQLTVQKFSGLVKPIKLWNALKNGNIWESFSSGCPPPTFEDILLNLEDSRYQLNSRTFLDIY